MKPRKIWAETLAGDKGLPRVVRTTARMSRRPRRGIGVIPGPREVDRLMRRAPKGCLVTLPGIRAALATHHHANVAGPITTGIFAWIAAHAAAEAPAGGKERVTPFWGTLKTGGQLNDRYPGGATTQRSRLASEGRRFVGKGSRCFAVDFERTLVPLTSR